MTMHEACMLARDIRKTTWALDHVVRVFKRHDGTYSVHLLSKGSGLDAWSFHSRAQWEEFHGEVPS